MKAGLYVDAHNLYRKDGPSLNYRAIRDLVSNRYELLRCNVYVTVDPENPKPVRGFMAALRGMGFKVIDKEWSRSFDGRVKANMDLELAVDMLTQVKSLDVIFLVSGDSDFIRLVCAVQNLGRRVEVIAFQDRIGYDLIKEADAFHSLESLEDIYLPEPELPEPPQPETSESPALQQLREREERESGIRRFFSR